MKGAVVTVPQADSYPGQLATNHLAIHTHRTRHVYALMTALFRFCTPLIGIFLGGMLAAGAARAEESVKIGVLAAMTGP